MDENKVPTDLKLKLRDILVAHDVSGFRLFMELHQSELNQSTLSAMDDERLSDFMHEYKSVQMSYGPEWQKSRNHLRLKKFHGNTVMCTLLPKCVECRWFRETPEGEEYSCMHLGSTPEDIACKGFVTLPKT